MRGKLPRHSLLFSRDEFAACYPLQVDVYDSFTGHVGHLFRTYQGLRKQNELQQFRATKHPNANVLHLSDQEFIERWEPPQWDTLNGVLEISGSRFRITVPNDDEPYVPQLRNDAGIVLSVDALSSGEKILTSIAFFLYSLDDLRFRTTKPDVLLLDEVDAPLHPRGGPKKSDSGLSGDSALIRGESRMNRSKTHETTAPQSLSDLQSEGSTDGD